MFKKLVTLLACVVAIPTMANAAWTVKASSANPTFGNVSTAGYNIFKDTDQNAKTFVVTAKPSYKIASILLNSQPVTVVDSFRQAVVVPYKAGTQLLVANFVANAFVVKAGSVTGGSIYSATGQTVTVGGTKSFTITPNPGNVILSVTDTTNVATDVPVANNAGMVYTLSSVDANHVITATFGTIQANAGSDINAGLGSVKLNGTGTAGATYDWTVVYAPAGSALKADAVLSTGTLTPSFTADVVGNYSFKLKVTVGQTSAYSTVRVNVFASAVDANAAAVKQCSQCHTQPGVDFTASKHWNNLRNAGDSAVVGDQKATCAASKCHFKAPTTNATGCNTCHSNGLNADGTFKATYTVGGYGDMTVYKATATNTCFSCHSGAKHGATTDNFKKSSHYTGEHGQLYFGEKGCVKCHAPHLPEATTYEVCKSCHRPGTAYGIYEADGVTLKTPHAPVTPDANGYYSQASFTGAGATCEDCHGHNNAINAGWAEGGHGNVNATPWISDSGHIWDNQGPATNGIKYQNSPQQTNCVRCHTAKGFAKFVESGFQNIDKNYQADGVTVSKTSAPLTCNGCHLNPDNRAATGYTNQGLRLANFTTASRGAKGYVAFYGYSSTTYATKKVITTKQLGDNRNSNICIPCHAQRTNGQLVKDVFAAGTANVKNIGSNIYPHDAQPASVFYGTGGYEFTSAANYTDRARHQRIGNYVAGGTTGYNNTGITQGSCVGCHYTPDSKYGIGTHAVEVVKFEAFSSALGRNTAPTVVSTECAKCHPNTFGIDVVKTNKDQFDAAVKALEVLLIKKGITQQTANGLTADSTKVLQSRASMDMSLGTNDKTIAEKNTGAWYNWFLFSTADKGAYVHNPSYARRLIYDSIDWLDDNNINGSSATTITNLSGVSGGNKLTTDQAKSAVSFTNEPGCLGCHYGTGAVANGENVPGIEQAPHMNVPAGKAQYVSANAQCNYCHGIGHGTDSPGSAILEGYAESAHGDINGEAWTHYDFKQSDRASCQMCHTTTGFIKYVTSNFKVPATADSWGTTGDTTKEVLACNACHSSTSWKTSIRTFATYSAPFGLYNAKFAASTSNLCLVCHTGQANKTIVDSKYATNANNTNVGLVNSHYLAAGAVLYKTSGYTFYADATKYANKSFYKHDKLGMNNYSAVSYVSGARAYDYSQNTGDMGPCVTCHMNGKISGFNTANSHSLSAVKVSQSMPASNGATVTTAGHGCYGCHGTEDMNEVIEGQKAGYQAALTLLKQVFAANGQDYDPANYPYFFPTGANHLDRLQGTTNWTFMNAKVTNGSAKLTHGAAFNLNLLTREPGAFAHNRYYAKRLIYDSLDYLQNGVNGSGDVNGTVNFTAFSSATVPVSAAKAYLGAARP